MGAKPLPGNQSRVVGRSSAEPLTIEAWASSTNTELRLKNEHFPFPPVEPQNKTMKLAALTSLLLLGIAPQAAEQPNTNPAVKLRVQMAEITNATGLGLDWIFGTDPTTVLPETTLATTIPGYGPVKGDNVRINQLHTEQQIAILTGPQYTALINQLEQQMGVNLLTAPSITTFSGRETMISVTETQTIITDVPEPTSSGLSTTSELQAESIPFGSLVNVSPLLSGDEWSLRVSATLVEFLGYSTGKERPAPIKEQSSLAQIRVRDALATAAVRSGETLVLRASPASESRTIKRRFRRDLTEEVQKQLYIFISPETVSSDQT